MLDPAARHGNEFPTISVPHYIFEPYHNRKYFICIQ